MFFALGSMFRRVPHVRTSGIQNRDRKDPRAGLRVLRLEPLEDRRLLSAVVPAASSRELTTAAAASLAARLSVVPLSAQYAISAALGKDQAAYHATLQDRGFTLANAANSFSARLQSNVTSITAGPNELDMSLKQIGRGDALVTVALPKVTADSNRVDADFGTVDQWYVNGPGGLQQGFTVRQKPQGTASAAAPLNVSIGLGGNLSAKVNAAGDGLTLTDAQGNSALGYSGLMAYDASGHTLPATLEVKQTAGRTSLLIHVNDAGAEYPLTIDPFIQQAKLTASDGAASDSFGYDVAISGDTLVVGAPGATVGGQPAAGAAYVFTRPDAGSAFTEAAKLTASDAAIYGSFGYSVAISGDTVVVGAPIANENGAVPLSAAYVFVRPASGWSGNITERAKLTSSDERSGDQFGISVAIDGDTIVIGARYAVAEAKSSYGAAYVYLRPATGWSNMTETSKLHAAHGPSGEYFGASVAISGNTVVVGENSNGAAGATDEAIAYLFVEPRTTWPRRCRRRPS
jgi:trimeric autotransporter adhesin